MQKTPRRLENGEGLGGEDVIEAELGVLLESVSFIYLQNAIANIHY